MGLADSETSMSFELTATQLRFITAAQFENIGNKSPIHPQPQEGLSVKLLARDTEVLLRCSACVASPVTAFFTLRKGPKK